VTVSSSSSSSCPLSPEVTHYSHTVTGQYLVLPEGSTYVVFSSFTQFPLAIS